MNNSMPKENTEKKNAIFFAISDNYSFAAANIIMGLNQYSKPLMNTIDIIIYHNGISKKNIDLLRSLHSNTYFSEMQFPDDWSEILQHPKTLKWGEFVVCKFFGFELIKKYEKVLHLDVDMHIRGDISELFQIEEEFAWRKIIGWNPDQNFADILPETAGIKSGNGGMFLFTDKLLKYNIDNDVIKDTFYKVKDLKKGGIDETVIAWIVFEKGIDLKEYDVEVFNTLPIYATPETKLIHFLDSYSISSKPWLNLASYLYYDDWAENYQKWLNMGGEGLVDFSKEDYYKLFAYDKGERIKTLKTKVTKLRKEKEVHLEKIAVLEKEIAELKKAKVNN